MMAKRAERRHQRARVKNARRFYLGRDLTTDPRRLGKLVHTATPCSCCMCRNSRWIAGPTYQEKKAFQDNILQELTAMTQPDPPTPHLPDVVYLPYYPEVDTLWRILLAGARNYWDAVAPSRHEWACASILEDYEYQASWCDTETREVL